MKVLRKFMFAAITAMPVVLCSCPEDCTEHEPKGYVVRMDNDYTGNVMVCMSIGKDTVYSEPIFIENHTFKLVDDYYLIYLWYKNYAYTSIKSSEWNDTLKSVVFSSVIDSDPFKEVYGFYENYSNDYLIDLIGKGSLSKLEKFK